LNAELQVVRALKKSRATIRNYKTQLFRMLFRPSGKISMTVPRNARSTAQSLNCYFTMASAAAEVVEKGTPSSLTLNQPVVDNGTASIKAGLLGLQSLRYVEKVQAR
jgi:hypothetical protein